MTCLLELLNAELLVNPWKSEGHSFPIHSTIFPAQAPESIANRFASSKELDHAESLWRKERKTRYRLVLVSSYGSTLSRHIRVKTVDPYQRSKNPVNQHQTNLSRETMVGFDILWATASITAIRLYGMPPIIKRCNLRCGELV